MQNVQHIETIEGYCRVLGTKAQHPLVNVTYLSELTAIPLGRKVFGFYCVYFNEQECGTVKYGRGTYEYSKGTMLFCSPGQTIGVDSEEYSDKPEGIILMFHPDIIYGTSLGKRMKNYSFFAYDSNEALHMNEEEEKTVKLCFEMIRSELKGPHDRHTQQIICTEMETLFNYCARFFDRQFSDRKAANNSIMIKLDSYLEAYFDSNRPHNEGIPTVQSCASEVCLSPNYFSDLVKKETGKTAQEYIHAIIVKKAKFHISETNMSISEIAYHLGFNYPHHLTRLFKKICGMTPNEFRLQLRKQ